MLRVFIEPDPLFDKEILYIWNLFALNKHAGYTLVGSTDGCDISIGSAKEHDIQISKSFFEKLVKGAYHHTNHFRKNCFIELDDGNEDLLSTAFYMVNAVQEKDHSVKDKFGRFPFSESYQAKFNCSGENLVQHIFDRLYNSIPALKSFDAGKRRTKIFLTHDIDTIHGSLLQDGFHSLKKGELFKGIKTLVKNLRHPGWLNMEEMMNIEEVHHFKSTFFWLTKKGKVNEFLDNSDYNIGSEETRNVIREVQERGFFNGMHKSAAGSTFEEEQQELGVAHLSNRYHYLKFNPSEDFTKIESAKCKLDSSLGFAETHGFRNSYGLPFQPFDLKERRALKFVEVPLNIMDTTFYNYKKASGYQAYEEIIDFVSRNQYDCIITVLFHNNFISDNKYGEYKKVFLKLLSYFNRENFECITEKEIIETYLNGN